MSRKASQKRWGQTKAWTMSSYCQVRRRGKRVPASRNILRPGDREGTGIFQEEQVVHYDWCQERKVPRAEIRGVRRGQIVMSPCVPYKRDPAQTKWICPYWEPSRSFAWPRQGGTQKTGTCLWVILSKPSLFWVSIPPSAKWATSKFPKFKPPVWPFLDFSPIPVLLVPFL